MSKQNQKSTIDVFLEYPGHYGDIYFSINKLVVNDVFDTKIAEIYCKRHGHTRITEFFGDYFKADKKGVEKWKEEVSKIKEHVLEEVRTKYNCGLQLANIDGDFPHMSSDQLYGEDGDSYRKILKEFEELVSYRSEDLNNFDKIISKFNEDLNLNDYESESKKQRSVSSLKTLGAIYNLEDVKKYRAAAAIMYMTVDKNKNFEIAEELKKEVAKQIKKDANINIELSDKALLFLYSYAVTFEKKALLKSIKKVMGPMVKAFAETEEHSDLQQLILLEAHVQNALKPACVFKIY